MLQINPLESRGNYSATSNSIKLVHWLLMGGQLHLVQRGGTWAGCGPAQSLPHYTKCNSPQAWAGCSPARFPPRYTKCNSPPINGQCMVRCFAVLMWP